MPLEIERRFLVRDPSVLAGAAGRPIVQGYFGVVDELSVRVRRIGDEAYLTFKGPRRGVARLEYEHPISVERAGLALQALPPERLVRKTRYEIVESGSRWVADRFHGAHDGLLIAEIELDRPDRLFAVPPWVGREVTSDERYGNSRLAAAGRTPLAA
jgi:adenylate cyclase